MMNNIIEFDLKPIPIQEQEDNLKTPEQIQYEEERWCNVRLMIDLVSSITMLGGKNEQYPRLNRLNLLNFESYSQDTWKTEYDRLTELHNKMKMREIEIIRAQICAWVNGHLNRFTFKIKLRNGKMEKFNCDAQSMYKVTELILILTDEYDRDSPPRILYEDEDGEKIEIASDSDLTEAVKYAKSVGRKYLYLDMDMENKAKMNWRNFDLPIMDRARARARAKSASPFFDDRARVPPLRMRMF